MSFREDEIIEHNWAEKRVTMSTPPAEKSLRWSPSKCYGIQCFQVGSKNCRLSWLWKSGWQGIYPLGSFSLIIIIWSQSTMWSIWRLEQWGMFCCQGFWWHSGWEKNIWKIWGCLRWVSDICAVLKKDSHKQDTTTSSIPGNVAQNDSCWLLKLKTRHCGLSQRAQVCIQSREVKLLINILRIGEVEAPKYLVLSGHEYLQHVGSPWTWNHVLQYHTIVIQESAILIDAVPFVYDALIGWELGFL